MAYVDGFMRNRRSPCTLIIKELYTSVHELHCTPAPSYNPLFGQHLRQHVGKPSGLRLLTFFIQREPFLARTVSTASTSHELHCTPARDTTPYLGRKFGSTLESHWLSAANKHHWSKRSPARSAGREPPLWRQAVSTPNISHELHCTPARERMLLVHPR